MRRVHEQLHLSDPEEEEKIDYNCIADEYLAFTSALILFPFFFFKRPLLGHNAYAWHRRLCALVRKWKLDSIVVVFFLLQSLERDLVKRRPFENDKYFSY